MVPVDCPRLLRSWNESSPWAVATSYGQSRALCLRCMCSSGGIRLAIVLQAPSPPSCRSSKPQRCHSSHRASLDSPHACKAYTTLGTLFNSNTSFVASGVIREPAPSDRCQQCRYGVRSPLPPSHSACLPMPRPFAGDPCTAYDVGLRACGPADGTDVDSLAAAHVGARRCSHHLDSRQRGRQRAGRGPPSDDPPPAAVQDLQGGGLTDLAWAAAASAEWRHGVGKHKHKQVPAIDCGTCCCVG